MAELEIHFLLPLEGWPRAQFGSDFTYDHARLTIAGAPLLHATTRPELERGLSVHMLPDGERVHLRLSVERHGSPHLELRVAGKLALREDELRPPPTPSAWIHATLALAASAAGFVASYLYVLRAAATDDPEWAMKMAHHMAGWHLLLTFALFPASLWGRRIGIRSVQGVSLLFFLIHTGIALANLGGETAAPGHHGWIAFFNALSGGLFLAATIYGNRAWRDMDPVAALRSGRLRRQPDVSADP